jgi:hypothetical protein
MKKKLTLKEVRNIFVELEKKYSVYSLESNNVYYWKLIRKEIYDYIIMKLGFVEKAHPMSTVDKVRRFLFLLKYSTINLFKKNNVKQSDVLILTHGRKNKINDSYEDIYLYDILRQLEKNNSSYFIIDRPDHYGKHLGKERNNMIYFERFGHIVREILYPFFIHRIKLTETRNIIIEVEKEIKERLNIDIDLEGLIKKRIFRFILEKRYFDKLLDKIRPDKVIMVVSYGKEELIASAKERDIETIEVQHGVISSYHMGYHFPFEFPIPYFPDEIILFGDYWKESVCFPVNSRQTINSFSFMKHSYNNRVISENKMNKVLFVSQGSIGVHLSKIAANFAYENQIDCYYKLHPSEFNNWRNRYSELSKCEIDGRIKVISNQNSIYELFNLCKYVIGVYSTAIYESLMYGCKTFVVKIEGYQYMEFLIDKNYVKLLSTDFCLNDLYDFQENKLENKRYFYA